MLTCSMFTADHSPLLINTPLTPLFPILTKSRVAKSFVSHTYEKAPGGPPPNIPSRLSPLPRNTVHRTRNTRQNAPLFLTLAPVSPVFATLTKSPGGGPPFPTPLLKSYLKCHINAAHQFFQTLSGEK